MISCPRTTLTCDSIALSARLEDTSSKLRAESILEFGVIALAIVSKVIFSNDIETVDMRIFENLKRVIILFRIIK